MTDRGRGWRRWWDAQVRGWEAIQRANAPWEQEGPLRWRRSLGEGWVLVGATLPSAGPGDG